MERFIVERRKITKRDKIQNNITISKNNWIFQLIPQQLLLNGINQPTQGFYAKKERKKNERKNHEDKKKEHAE